jgi:hypothetical protein
MDGQTIAQGLQHYHKECGERYQIAPDRKQFAGGYDSGLKIFCSPKKASEFASHGGEYQGTCPDNQELGFLQSYTPAATEYMKKQNENLTKEVSDLKSKVSDLESEKSSLEAEVSSLKMNCH